MRSIETGYTETGGIAQTAWRQTEMLAIAAGAAFVGLFALWVIVPRFVLRRRHNESNPMAAMPREEFAPQAAD